jgi:hypothetical protein
MDYCKFENTLLALRQCADGWDEEVKGDREISAKQRLIELMVDLLNEEGYEIDQVDREECTDFLPAFSQSTGLRIG